MGMKNSHNIQEAKKYTPADNVPYTPMRTHCRYIEVYICPGKRNSGNRDEYNMHY
jgi:hypothetical protein